MERQLCTSAAVEKHLSARAFEIVHDKKLECWDIKIKGEPTQLITAWDGDLARLIVDALTEYKAARSS